MNNRFSSLIRQKNFQTLWAVGILTNIARWLDLLVVGVYGWEITNSPFLVALLMLLRLLPLALLGPVVGTLADRLIPKKLLSSSLLLAGLSSLTIFILFMTQSIEYWHITVCVVISGTVWATDFPLRRRMLGDSIQRAKPKKRNVVSLNILDSKSLNYSPIQDKEATPLATAMSLDTATNNATRMLGPLVGGFIYYWIGPDGAFALNAVLYFLAAIVLINLPVARSIGVPLEPITHSIKDFFAAFSYAWSNRDLRSVLLITIIFNIWGFPFLSMIPVIGGSFSLNPSWIGILVALEGAGAFLGALIVASKVKAKHFRLLFFLSTLFYLLLIFILGWLHTVIPFAILLIFIGIIGAGFSTMQSTLIFTIARPEMRGRLFGLVVACIGTGLLGSANIGLMGELFGGSLALSIIAAEGLIPLIIVGLIWREMWQTVSKNHFF